MQSISATYSPEDNKLRLYASHRLDAETYARVKAAGFSWAPKQDLFVAPMWTPLRADLAEELAGEIGDEDTSLVDRAEMRSDRFEGYADRRAADADSARRGVEAIAGRFEFGQPILVGHHSERRARKDAERMQNGMRTAVTMWERSEYWTARAAGAVRAAKYKERTDVRHRRIKGIEADQRKAQRDLAELIASARMWAKVPRIEWDRQTEAALYIAGKDGLYLSLPHPTLPNQVSTLYSEVSAGRMHGDRAWRVALEAIERRAAHVSRWLDHYANRLAYERAMLAEAGGIKAEAFDLQPGGRIKARYGWQVIERVNRRDGQVLSVSVIGQGWTVGIEEITEYQAPTEESAKAIEAVTKLAPLVNYDAPGRVHMKQAEYLALYKDWRGTTTVKATETAAAHRVRTVDNFIARKHGAKDAPQWGRTEVFLTDGKVTPAPMVGATKRKSTARKIVEASGIDTAGHADPVADEGLSREAARAVIAEAMAPTADQVHAEAERLAAAHTAREEREADRAPYAAMRESLRTGQAVQVVSAPQLFPTPAALAARMVDLACPSIGARVLEPSAGTGRLLAALPGLVPTPVDGSRHTCCAHVVAVEISGPLARQLEGQGLAHEVRRADFLDLEPAELGTFDVVLMNPPFANAVDVKHIQHARRFLAPGGRLVAICAGGPRQAEALKPIASTWEPLPAGTFAEAGTGVHTVLLTIDG